MPKEPAGEEPQGTVAAPPAAGEKPQSSGGGTGRKFDPEQDLDNMGVEDLAAMDAALEQSAWGAPVAPVEPEGDPTPEAAPPTEPPTAEEPEGGEAAEPVGQPEPTATPPEEPAAESPPVTTPSRVSLKSLPPEEAEVVAAAVAAKREGKPLTAEQRQALLDTFGITPDAPAAAPDPTPEEAPETPPAGEQPTSKPEATPEPDPKVTALESELSSLEADLESATKDYDEPEKIRLLREVGRKERELERAKEDASARAEADRDYSRVFTETVTGLKKDHPDLNDPNSALSQRVGELRDLAEFRQDPIVNDPKFLATLVEKAKGELAPPTAPPPEPTTPAEPVGEVSSGTEGTGRLVGDPLRNLEEIPLDTLDEALLRSSGY